MQLVSMPYTNRVIVTVAKGDPEYKQWRSWQQTVSWPSSWVYFPGDQMEFLFPSAEMSGT
jgi:hypothetical protein